ncbi:MAG: sigma-70 family RNA polymerase sigma factor [Planctomycetota bacterium]
MTRAEERALIERAIAGDRDAAAACIRAHERGLYAYILRMCGRPETAEDICQEAFVRVITHLDRFDFKYRFSTWLFTIAKRLYLNHAQKMRPSSDSDLVGGWDGDSDMPWEGAASSEQGDVARVALRRALQKMSDEQREVLVLFHQQEWPIALIAQHLGMPQGTVKSHLHRGRRKLKALLEREERRLLEASGYAVATGAGPFVSQSETGA